jgi:predicted RND superfamily exporter protein
LKRLINGLLHHRALVLIIALIITVIAGLCIPLVEVHYDLTDYLPEQAPSTKAIKIADQSFAEGLPNANLYIPDITIPQAIELKEQLKTLPHVESVLWLDDATDIYQPLASLDSQLVDSWYKNGGALFMLRVDPAFTVEATDAIRQAGGENAVLTGEAFNQATIQALSMGEVSRIMFFVVPLVLLVLLISTSSWFEPLLFLVAIGVAIVLNEGTNIIMPDVSYVTRAASATLQLAVSMDYAVFLLHSFSRFRQQGNNIEEAMKLAVHESIPAIAASAATTVFGFLALGLMQFRLGANLGLILAKGILFSFLSVIILLPVLTVLTTKWVDRTQHRPFLPSFRGFARVVVKICLPLAIVVVLIVIPSYMGQRQTDFIYGSSGIHSPESQAQADIDKLAGIFGENQQMMLLVPSGNIALESKLSEELDRIPEITTVIDYSKAVGAQVPREFIPDDALDQFETAGLSRYILYADVPVESDRTFQLVERIRKLADSYYPGKSHLLGQPAVNYDLKTTIIADTPVVQGGSVLAIGLVILITFRSLSIPLILLLTIEGAIWINLGIPYFAGTSLNYIGYQIISAVQLGATVDYGILFASHFLNNRRTMEKRPALRLTLETTTPSILTPASILTIAAGLLGVVSSNGIISQLGIMLARGAVISSLMVLFFLPALLILFDRVIPLLTWGGWRKKEVPHES